MSTTAMSIKEIPLIINGERVRSKTNDWLDVLNPATQEVVARVPMATPEEVNAAVSSAQQAFKSWSQVSLTNRMRIMVTFAHLVRENTQELAELVTLEHGKTLPDAEGEVGRALEAIENACSVTRLQLGDMGNNVARFGAWNSPVDWHEIFRVPDFYLQNIITDTEIERNFKYKMPVDVREQFSKSENIDFDVNEHYKIAIRNGDRPKVVLDASLDQHSKMCLENSEDLMDARNLAELLSDQIAYRIRLYSYCICKSTDNYLKWLKEDYERRLRQSFSGKI